MDHAAPSGQNDTAERVKRFGRLVAHGTGTVFALAAAVIAALFLIVSGRGVAVEAFHDPIEQTIALKTGAREVEIGELRLVRDRTGPDPFKLTMTDFVMDQGDGNIVQLPKMSIRVVSASLAKGRIAPKFIEIDGASVAIERQGEDVSFEGSFDFAMLARLATQISEVQGTGFEGARLNDFAFTYRDLEAGTVFQAGGGTASVRQSAGRYDFDLVVPFPSDEGAPGSLNFDAAMQIARGRINATLAFDNVPAEQFVSVFLAREGRVELDAPISGSVSASGDLLSGTAAVDVDLAIGAGELHVDELSIPVTSLKVEGRHDILERTFRIARLDLVAGGASGRLDGELAYATGDGAISELAFDVAASDISYEREGLFQAPVSFSRLKTAGRYDTADALLKLTAFEADYFETTISGRATADFTDAGGPVPAITAEVAVDGILTPQQVLNGWPIPAADGARRWVVANMPRADVSGVTFDLSLPPGSFADGKLPEDAVIDLDFRVDNATIIYVPGMTPVTDLSASAGINGNSFFVRTERGRLGAIAVTGGSIDMPRLVPQGAPATYVSKVEGDLSDILSVIDEEPLGFVSKSGLSPDDFGGRAQFELTMVRPMLVDVPLSDYRFSGSGGFRGLTLTLFGDRLPLTDGTGSVTMQSDGLTVTGLVNAFGTASSFQWNRPFGTDIQQTVVADTKVNPRAADSYGIPLRRYLRGAVDARIEAVGDQTGFETFKVGADLTPATLITESGRVIKQAGVEGEANIVVRMPKDAPLIMVPQLNVIVPGMNVEGNARFTREGALIDVDLPRVWIDQIADLGLKVSRSGRRVKLSVFGEYANATGLIDTMLSARSDGEGARLPGGVDVDIALDRVGMKAGAELLDVNVVAHHNGAELAKLQAGGIFADGGALAIDLRTNDKGLGEDVEITTDRFGTLLRGLFGVESVLGGRAEITATLIDEGPIAGEFRATDIVMRAAPVVAQLLSIGSLDGLANVLNGEGLAFSELSGDIQLTDGQLRLVDARLTGSALGLSANGTFDLANNQVGLHGAVAPAYRVNSLIGGVPGLGELFVSREGEGVFALAYRISGSVENATIEVNSLAALTPGIFRRIFEPVGDDLPSTEELLAEAEKAAGDTAARDFLSTPELLREYEREEAERAKAQGLNEGR